MFLVVRELTDAVIHLRRELYDINSTKHEPSEVKEHLNSLEHSFKRNWRSAVQSDKTLPLDHKKIKISDTEKSNIYDLLKIENHHLQSYFQNDGV